MFVCFSHRHRRCCCRECSKQAICQKWQCYPPVRQEISYWICDVMEAGLFDTTWVSWIIKWHIFLFLLPRLGNNSNVLAGVLAVCRHFHSNCSVNNSHGREDKSIAKPWLLSSKWEGNLRTWTFVFSWLSLLKIEPAFTFQSGGEFYQQFTCGLCCSDSTSLNHVAYPLSTFINLTFLLNHLHVSDYLRLIN